MPSAANCPSSVALNKVMEGKRTGNEPAHREFWRRTRFCFLLAIQKEGPRQADASSPTHNLIQRKTHRPTLRRRPTPPSPSPPPPPSPSSDSPPQKSAAVASPPACSTHTATAPGPTPAPESPRSKKVKCDSSPRERK